MSRFSTPKIKSKTLLYSSVGWLALTLAQAHAANFDVASQADLIAAINSVNTTAGSHTITFTGNVTINPNAGALPAITSSVAINGGNFSLTSSSNLPVLQVTGANAIVTATNFTSAIGTGVTNGVYGVTNGSNLGTAPLFYNPNPIVTLNNGTIRTDANITSAHNILLSGNSIINSNAKTSTLAGNITGAGNLTINGGGSVDLKGNNTYSGGTMLDHATVGVLSKSLGSGAIVANGGTLKALDNLVVSQNVTTQGDGFTINNNSFDVIYNGTMGGGGSFTSSGTGNTSLLGAQTYTGGTTIASGTMTLGNGANAGSVQGPIVNHGTLAVNNNNPQTMGNLITGTGGMAVKGTGTLTLTADNTFSGTTHVNNGTLQLGNGGTTGMVAGPINIGPNGNMVVNHSNPTTLSQPITGTGGLTLTGTGTTTIVGANPNFTGTTTINPNASLQLGNGVTNGTVGGNIVNNGQLLLNQATNTTLNGNISGTGSLHQNGPGNVTLAGQTTYTGTTYVNQGTLTVSGTLTGAVQTGTGTSLIVNGPGTTINGGYTCATINSCTLTNGGTGGTGTGTGTGGTGTGTGGVITDNVTTGANSTTTVNGTVGGIVTVIPTSTLTGTGTIGGANVSGTFAPGNAAAIPSVMTVNGNLVMNPNSTYQVYTAPNGSTYANVSGTATLTGANLNVGVANGTYTPGTNFTLLQASGGVNGTFASSNITPNMYGTLIMPRLVYSANSVNLILSARHLSPFAGSSSFAHTMATGFDATLGNNQNRGAYHALYDLPQNQIPQALSQFSGQVTASASKATAQVGNQFLSAMVNDGTSMLGDPLDYNTTASVPMTNLQPTTQRSDLKAHEFTSKTTPRELPPTRPRQLLQHQAWGALIGQVGNTNGDNSSGAYSTSSRAAGFAGGYSYRPSSDLLVGVALSGTSMNYGVSGGLGSGSGQSLQGGLYGKYSDENLYMSGALMAGVGSHETNRTLSFGGFNQALNGKFGTASLGARFETGLNIGEAARKLSPYVAYQYQNIRTNAFNEKDATGATVGNSYAGTTMQSHRAEIGLQTSNRVNFAEGKSLILRGKVAYAHEFGNSQALQATYMPLGINFIVPTAPVDRNLLLLSLNADYMLNANLALFTKVSGELSKSTQQVQGQIGVKATW